MATKTLHILHASGKFDLSPAAWEADLRTNLGRNPDIYTTTECDNFIVRFREVCREMNYIPVVQKYKDCPIAVKVDKQIKLKNHGAVFEFAGEAGKFPSKACDWVQLKFHGVSLYHHAQHWIPIQHLTSANYIAKHNLQSNTLVVTVRKHAKNNSYATFSGDVNDDDQRKDGKSNWNQITRAGNLMTVWDEKHVYPNTMGGHSKTIDVIGKYDEDGIKATRYKAYPKGNSDHVPVSCWYEVEVDKTTHSGPHGGTGAGHSGGGGSHTPSGGDHSGYPATDDPYATAGNVDWSDYLNSDVYELPYAVDDTDTENG